MMLVVQVYEGVSVYAGLSMLARFVKLSALDAIAEQQMTAPGPWRQRHVCECVVASSYC